MKETQFSAEFLAKLGVQAWQENPNFVSARSLKTPPKVQTDYQVPQPLEMVEPLDESVEPVVVAETPAPAPIASTTAMSSVQVEKVPFIVIGEDLSRVWQNDESLEWQLWKNIAEVFGWGVEQIPFYDTLLLNSEDAIMATLEEVMEMELDWVLSMDAESLLAEHLQEGLRVKPCPSLSTMLSDPYAKKTFYQLMLQMSVQ
ncbi:hypothetical protein [Thiosulfativibrio zosterae]|uniref:Uncharacterized protein n=1 Tax=Thiosulfativibrio zosterae TaxID=2675053 RepID=A0A6F8PLH4_9GAMM|nr:hypothetical protein [Thiosulfativibrio zosterae]BBP42961.1 hypothetical protein THMIRHAT_07070 [Thiosulfativibrio zosterae]